jgi:hypothetical protein
MGLHVGVVQGPLNCCAEAEVQAENLHPEKVEEIERGKRKKDIKRVPVCTCGEWWRMENVAGVPIQVFVLHVCTYSTCVRYTSLCAVVELNNRIRVLFYSCMI